MTDQIVNFALLGAEWVLYLLVFLSVLSVAVMVERGMFFHRRKIDTKALQTQAVRAVREDTVNAFRKAYGEHPSLPAKVALAGIERRHDGVAAASEAMNSAKVSTRESYEELTTILGTLGNNAPFIGLFGTVLGIIQAFHDLQQDPTGGINAVMGSTSEALVATAVGILVAIPAVVAFNWFNRLKLSHLGYSDAVAHAILSAMHTSSGGTKPEGDSESEDE